MPDILLGAAGNRPLQGQSKPPALRVVLIVSGKADAAWHRRQRKLFGWLTRPVAGEGVLKTERGNSSSIRKKSPYTGDMKKASAQAEALGKGTGEGGRVAEGSGEAGSGSHPQGVR